MTEAQRQTRRREYRKQWMRRWRANYRSTHPDQRSKNGKTQPRINGRFVEDWRQC